MSSSKSRNRRVLALSAGGDGRNELYNKRKAPELSNISRQSQAQLGDKHSEGHTNTLVESTAKAGKFPKKKPRLESPLYLCDSESCYSFYEKGMDVIAHRNFNGVIEYLRSDPVSTGSPITSESSTSTTAESCFDSDSNASSLTNDSLSYRSVPSSRSSSRAPELETRQCITFPSDLVFEIQPRCASDFQSALIHVCAIDLPNDDQTGPPSGAYEVLHDKIDAGSMTSLERDPGFETQQRLETQPDNEDPDQSSLTATAASSNRSHPTGSSVMEPEDQSTEGDGSSHTQDSSSVSDSGVSDVDEDSEQCGTLQDLIKNDVMRLDQGVAEHLCRSLDGRLVCAPPTRTDQFEDTSQLSLLQRLELQESSIVDQEVAWTTYAPSSSGQSSSSSTSTPNKGGAISSSSKGGQGRGSDGPPTGHVPAPPAEDRGQSTKSQKNTRSNSTQDSEVQLLRCCFNAMFPELFCVNQETGQKYRSCIGPGYNTMQHLKEHNKNHHTSKPNPLQCNRCQEAFRNQPLLKRHEMNVDCPIRCPECSEEFELKAMRQAHQEQTHPPEAKESKFMEIDEAKEKQIKDNLKAYVDSLKKGKGRIDPDLEQWVEANTNRYMVGRNEKANPKLELGQWYTICSTLFGEVAQHPFYDYGVSHAELVSEKILLIQDAMIDARIEVHGEPPKDIQAQRGWYQDALRDTLRLAAKTRLVLADESEPSSESTGMTHASYAQGYKRQRSASDGHRTEYAMPSMATNGEEQLSTISSQYRPNMVLPNPNYLPDNQPVNTVSGLSNVMQSVPSDSGLVTGEMAGYNWNDPYQHNMAAETGQQFPQQFNLEFGEDYNMNFGPSGSDILGNHPQYPSPSSDWTGQQGH